MKEKVIFDECGYGWFDNEIKSVSDGLNWSTFENMLMKSGYKGIS